MTAVGIEVSRQLLDSLPELLLLVTGQCSVPLSDADSTSTLSLSPQSHATSSKHVAVDQCEDIFVDDETAVVMTVHSTSADKESQSSEITSLSLPENYKADVSPLVDADSLAAFRFAASGGRRRRSKLKHDDVLSKINSDNCSSQGRDSCSSQGRDTYSSSSQGHEIGSSQGHESGSSQGRDSCSSQGRDSCSSLGHENCSSQGHVNCSSSKEHESGSSQGHESCSSQGYENCSSQEHENCSSSKEHESGCSHGHESFSSQGHENCSSHEHENCSSKEYKSASSQEHENCSSKAHDSCSSRAVNNGCSGAVSENFAKTVTDSGSSHGADRGSIPLEDSCMVEGEEDSCISMLPDIICSSQKECIDLVDYAPALIPPPPPLLGKRKAISINIADGIKKILVPSLRSSPESTSALILPSASTDLSKPSSPVPTLKTTLTEPSSGESLHITVQQKKRSKKALKKKKFERCPSKLLNKTDRVRILKGLLAASGISSFHACNFNSERVVSTDFVLFLVSISYFEVHD
jgi:hypothetical protein